MYVWPPLPPAWLWHSCFGFQSRTSPGLGTLWRRYIPSRTAIILNVQPLFLTVHTSTDCPQLHTSFCNGQVLLRNPQISTELTAEALRLNLSLCFHENIHKGPLSGTIAEYTFQQGIPTVIWGHGLRNTLHHAASLKGPQRHSPH